ncbi:MULTISPECIES: RidA family protein [Bacillaceae]|uniref:RidA family protein n=1 Tax=Bacillaceae TaxID=186817 RepID=UPI001E5B6281|nr:MULTISPECIES: RidA family protein [Bacillaceae]
MKKPMKLGIAGLLALSLGFGSLHAFSSDGGEPAPDTEAETVEETTVVPDEVTFYGSESSTISSAVTIPADTTLWYSSGSVPPELDPDGETVYERYGDTKQQAIGILEQFEEDLEEEGLSLADVTYLRVYITPDEALDGEMDYTGWFEAYGEFFDNDSNPVKPARSTVGVAGLVNSDWLIEIEAVAAYPED